MGVNIILFAKIAGFAAGVVVCASLSIVAYSSYLIVTNGSNKSIGAADPSPSPAPLIRLNSTDQFYYFPKLGDKSVTFEEARTACPAGYKLAGPETTNFAFLQSTKHLVETSDSDAVWTAAYVKSVDVINWANGQVATADFKTMIIAMARGSLCAGINAVKNDVPIALTRLPGKMIPLIRTKQNPHCLSLASDAIVTGASSFKPLCIRSVWEPFMVDGHGDQILVPKFFTDHPMLLDRESKVFNNMADRLKCLANKGSCAQGETSKTHEEAIGVRSYAMDEPPYIAGFSQSVDLKTARAICAAMRYGSANSNQGQFLTFDLLNGTGGASRNLISNLKQSIDFLMSYNKKLAEAGEKLYLNDITPNVGPMNVFIPTAGYLDWSNVLNKTTVNATVLMWKYGDGSLRKIADWDQTVAGEVKLASGIGWCTNRLGGLIEFNSETEIYSTDSGRIPSNQVPIGIRGSNGTDSTPCLFAAFIESKLPSSVSWAPTCQLSP